MALSRRVVTTSQVGDAELAGHHRVVERLGDDPAALDQVGVHAVADGAGASLGAPLQQRHPVLTLGVLALVQVGIADGLVQYSSAADSRTPS